MTEQDPRSYIQKPQLSPRQNKQTSGGRYLNDEPSAARVWRACVECRRKKSKCDGNDQCNACRIRMKQCIYPESNDNAATSRQFTATFEARFEQMEAWYRRMDTVIGKLVDTIQGLENTVLAHASSDRQSYVPNQGVGDAHQQSKETMFPNDIGGYLMCPENEKIENNGSIGDADEHVIDQDDEHEESAMGGRAKQDHIMTIDSYGKLRFVGGTSTMVMIEALKALSPSAALGTSPASVSASASDTSVSTIELPFFVRGKIFPRLPDLPHANQFARPPRYISDLLINIYFDQLHYTMPVLYKPHFLQRYSLLLNQRSSDNVDAEFLSVFFAVCACASGLLPRELGSSSSFTGLKYYENSILLHYASTGSGTIEQVQCLSLLSMCSAGWNTLAQSWKFAGHAVRAAQDLGLHRSPARGAGETLKEELCRRIWWSVYSLDRILSICLGRPMAIEDADCDCEIPLDMDDSELEIFCRSDNTRNASLRRSVSGTPSSSGLGGFLSLLRLCQLSGKITRSVNYVHLKQNRKGYKKAAEPMRLARELDLELESWLKNVPDPIAYLASSASSDSSGDVHLTMYIISYIVHAGCVINLHWPLIPDADNEKNILSENPSFQRCLDAARSCIRVSELIPDRVPPSHHLAFSVHYLTLSGIFLLRSPAPLVSPAIITEIEKCASSLRKLATTWTGAQRSRLIVEELLKQSKLYQKKRSFDDFRELEEVGVLELEVGSADPVFRVDQDFFADLFKFPEGSSTERFGEDTG